ncbi:MULTISPECIES: MFS transporter [unclassified Iodidimonas]|jgi:GPH family glycoside/pentoside/hexuronide:cation symporter|uniref:MFS transporter n=1 Tax=unclassified Iodidimonas TaxID=2626145 RepID=UPI0024821F6C|nr:MULTISPECIES: MFS transporter [unclassified Iodidimonas]
MRLGWRTRIGYGSGDYALNLFWQGTGYYLFFFYTDVIGLPVATAGVIFAIGGLWDAISDSLMGYWAERTKSRYGTYRPYLLYGCLPLALSFIAVFYPYPIENELLLIIVLTLALLVFRSAYTLVSIPYAALSVRLSQDSDERTRLATVRIVFGFLGGITAIILAGGLQDQLSDRLAFPIFATLCACLSVPILLFCFRNCHETAASTPLAPAAYNLGQLIKAMRHNSAFLLLCGGIILVTLGGALIGKTVLYIFVYDLGDRAAGNLTILIMTIIPILTIPLWSLLALRSGKKIGWLAGSATAFIGMIFLYADRSGSVLMAMLGYGVISAGLSSFAVLFWSMLPDTIEFGDLRSGVRHESALVGLISSMQKASMAGSALLLGILLDLIGYQAEAMQSPQTLDGLRMIAGLIPAMAMVLSALAIAFYPISTASHQRTLRDLATRDQKAESPAD